MKLTEQQIIDAAISVLNDNPSATLEMVAEKAGVTSRTLYRYFNDRTKLINSCKEALAITCKAAINAAFDASNDPLKQLELTLYAGIDCGSKYAFFEKLNQNNQPTAPISPQPDSDYTEIYNKWLNLIIELQWQGIVTKELTPAWIHKLFSGMVNTTISAITSGDVALNDVKKFAWISFSQSIGIQKQVLSK